MNKNPKFNKFKELFLSKNFEDQKKGVELLKELNDKVTFEYFLNLDSNSEDYGVLENSYVKYSLINWAPDDCDVPKNMKRSYYTSICIEKTDANENGQFDLNSISNFTYLESVEFENLYIDLSALKNCTKIESLSFSSCKGVCLEVIEHFDKINEINIESSDIDYDFIKKPVFSITIDDDLYGFEDVFHLNQTYGDFKTDDNLIRNLCSVEFSYDVSFCMYDLSSCMNLVSIDAYYGETNEFCFDMPNLNSLTLRADDFIDTPYFNPKFIDGCPKLEYLEIINFNCMEDEEINFLTQLTKSRNIELVIN